MKVTFSLTSLDPSSCIVELLQTLEKVLQKTLSMMALCIHKSIFKLTDGCLKSSLKLHGYNCEQFQSHRI